MKRNVFLLLMLSLFSCRSIPDIQPINISTKQVDDHLCADIFPQGEWQFIHSIEATIPDHKKAVVIGITNISSKKREIKVVMMTIEGLVLFDAEYGNELKVNKGISPFNSREFAISLMDDIRLIFFNSEGKLEQSGYLENGSYVCRHKTDEGKVIDVSFTKDNEWEIIKYNDHNKIERVVHIDLYHQKTGKSGIPHEIDLKAYGKHRYSLTLDLIKAKKISD